LAPIDPHSTRVFAEVRARPRYRVDVLGALHGSFTNNCETIGASLDAELPPGLHERLLELGYRHCTLEEIAIAVATQRITNLYAVAFFKRHVVEDPDYGRFLTPEHVEQAGLPVEFFVVPEPSHTLLCIFALGTLAAVSRRRTWTG
jgi:predicted dienelactone hydrolase